MLALLRWTLERLPYISQAGDQVAAIVNERSRERVLLEAVHLVGRSEHSSLRLSEAHVSQEHASIRWDGNQWLVRDLGSLNKTFVDDLEVRGAEPRVLRAGARLAFGRRTETWLFENDDPPSAMAVPEDGGEADMEEDGLLALPSAADPIATVFRGVNGAWQLDVDGSAREVADQERVTVLGRSYRICLPQVASRTLPVQGLQGRRTSELTLEFFVSSDLEHIELVARYGSEEHRFAARAHHEMLMLLARARREDQDAGLPAANCGWLYHDELCKRLRLEPDRLNVDVYRIRQQFAKLGLLDPGEVVQRRSRSRQLRLGLAVTRESPLG